MPPGERLDGPGLTSGPDRFAVEGAIGAERVRPGRIILTAGTVTSPHPEGDRGERVRFALRDEDGEDRYEFLIVCPGDMQMPTARRKAHETRGLRFDQAVTADRLDPGQIVTLDGYVMSVVIPRIPDASAWSWSGRSAWRMRGQISVRSR